MHGSYVVWPWLDLCSICKSSTTNAWNTWKWNVIEIESVNLGHFLSMSRFMPFWGLTPPQASCDLFFLDLKRGMRVLRVLHLWVEQERCSSLEWVFTLIRLFCCITILIWSRFYRCFYVRKEELLIFRCAYVQNLKKKWKKNVCLLGTSVCLWNIGTALPHLYHWTNLFTRK